MTSPKDVAHKYIRTTLKEFAEDAIKADGLDVEVFIPLEFDDVVLPLVEGAKKYPGDGWLEGKFFNRRDNHASMSRHLAEYYMGVTSDKESGLDPLLHLACRALMAYTVRQWEMERLTSDDDTDAREDS